MIQLKKYKPHDGQQAFHYAIEKLYRFVAMICGIRGGKCLSLNQEVLLDNGETKKAGDIIVGDNIMAFDSGNCASTKVISVEETIKETALYVLSDGSTIECSTDHAFPCWNNKREKIEEHPISHIAERSNNYLYLLSSRSVEFTKSEQLKIHPYLLGVILGDGCISQSCVSISTADNEILDACRDLSRLEVVYRSKYDYGLVSRERDKNGYGYNWLVSELRSLNLIGTNSHTKFIPHQYLTSTEENRIELLSGLIDTDGHVDDRGHIEITLASRELIKGIQFILRGLGIRTRIRNKPVNYNGETRIYYRLHWKSDKLNLRIKRKAESVRPRIAQCSDKVYIETVKSLGMQKCVDISIDHPSHLFLLDNFIATHNTYSGAREASKQAWNSKSDETASYGIVAPTYNMLDRTTWQEFKYAARPLIASCQDSKKTMMLKNGRTVYGFSAEKPDRIRNVTLCGFWVDEARECKDFKGLWDILLGRVLSTHGKGIVTTSPNSYDDIHDIFVANRRDSYGLLRFPTYTNSYISKAHIDELASQYDEKFMQQELMGEFIVFEGQVYYTFNRNESAGDLAFKVANYDPDMPICLCCDFNVDPMAWVIAQIVDRPDKLREIRVVDEIFIKNSNTEKCCTEFKARYPNHRSGIILYGDATGHSRSTTSNLTNWKIIQDELSRYGVTKRVPSSNPAERDRINAVNARICNSKGQRFTQINPKCKHLIRDLEQVPYKAGSVHIDKTRDLTLSHISDAFGYMVEKEFSLRRGEITGLRI